MKRCVLLQKISSIDAVRQIFSQAFSEVINIEEFYGQDPLLTIYILDTVAAVFYEMVHQKKYFLEVRNLSVLKIFDKRPRNKIEVQHKNKSPKKKKDIKMASHDLHANIEGKQLINLGSVQSLPPPSPQSRPDIDVLKMKSREVCCFGGVLGYHKLPKTVLSSSKPTTVEADPSSQNSPGIEPSNSVTKSNESTKMNSTEVCQTKQYHSLDRYHSPGCHHHHHHHRSNKKLKAGTQSANSSPSNDYYGQYSLHGSHCGCCHHYCNCDNYLQRCRHHQQPQQSLQSTAKQPKSPLKLSQQRNTWTGHQPHCQNVCHPHPHPLSDPRGSKSNECLLPVDLLNTTTGSNVSQTKSPSNQASKNPTSEIETRMRISQLEDQLASLTQWVQNSIEAERSGHATTVQKVSRSVGHGTSPSRSEMDKSQTLQTIQGRLSGMLTDVAQLRDQCQHLKVAHQVQRQEIHEALAYFSRNIIAFVRRGMISEDILWCSMSRDISSLRLKQDSTDNEQLLEATHAELLKYGEPNIEVTQRSIIPDTGDILVRLPGKVELSKSSKSIKRRDPKAAKETNEMQASTPNDRESTRSPDLVRSNRGNEIEVSSNASIKTPSQPSTEEKFYDKGNESSNEIWISMDKFKKLSTR